MAAFDGDAAGEEGADAQGGDEEGDEEEEDEEDDLLDVDFGSLSDTSSEHVDEEVGEA